MPPTIEYRTLKSDEIAAAGTVLGRAFRDSPSYAAILAHLTEERRAAAIVRVTTAFTAAAVHHEVADAAWVNGRLAAIALIAAPGQWPPSLAVFVRHALGCLSTGPTATANFLRADAYMTKHHLKQSHHYLFVLGVEPELQGRGLGKGLLARMSDRADAERLPCYLETDKERNVRLYESAGYRVLTDEMVPTKPGYRMWSMQRSAREN